MTLAPRFLNRHGVCWRRVAQVAHGGSPPGHLVAPVSTSTRALLLPPETGRLRRDRGGSDETAVVIQTRFEHWKFESLVVLVLLLRLAFVRTQPGGKILKNFFSSSSSPTKYLWYWCEAKDFVHLRDKTRWNFMKTKIFRLRKASFNTTNFR